MSDLPTGTVTFLFTDIEGSTRLLQRLGPRYADALAEHRELLRAAFGRWNGHEVDTQGDAFFVAFARAADALACAADAQRTLAAYDWPEGEAVRVRIGLHTGEPIATGSGYVGLDVHRGSRICSAGHGGQILLSGAARDLVANALPEGSALRDLGEHRLKDLQRPERLYELVLDGLPDDFPPLRTLVRNRHNLPVQPTPLLGRERDLAAVCAMLRGDDRLVTLTGPGGIGKTRLGLQVAAELGDAYADGVYYVSLSPVFDANLVPAIVAQALGLRDGGGRTPAEGLSAYLAERAVLLLLDNFEQVADAAPFVAGLLAACPHIKALATSRELLHLRGEQEYPVPPLELPAHSALNIAHRAAPDVDVLSRYPAVALFIQRARAVKPNFEATSANVAAIAELCARLDGLPLAIELAAAHVKLLSPQAMIPRLAGRLDLLSGGARDLPDRQRTLRNTIDWSYGLLAPEDQMLFRCLSVFSGGWTLEAAEAVFRSVDTPGFFRGPDILEGLGALVDKNLVQQREGDDGEPRFTMLQTIRAYAHEQLDASGDADLLHRVHAEYYLELAERAEPHLTRRDQAEWLHRLEREHGNLRAALAWACDGGDTAIGLRLAGALWRFWYTHGYLCEGRDWLERLLNRSRADESKAGTLLRAKALVGAATLASTQDDLECAVMLGEESLALSRTLGDSASIADALNAMGFMALHRGEVERAVVLFEESLKRSRELGDPWAEAKVLSSLGQCAYFLADYTRAQTLFEECLALLRQVGSRSHIATNQLYLGHVARRQGATARAAAHYREALALSRDLGDKLRIARGLEALGTLAADEQQPERAARLLGAASELRESLGASLHPLERPSVDSAIAVLHQQLGEAACAAAWNAGRALSLHDAVAEALNAAAVAP